MLAIHFRARRPERRQLLQRRRRLLWRDASLVLTVNRAPHTGQLLDHRSSVLPLVRNAAADELVHLVADGQKLRVHGISH